MEEIKGLSRNVKYNHNLQNKLRFKKLAGNISAYYYLDLRSNSIDKDISIIADLFSENYPFVVFGGCTNLYITERGYNGLFIEIQHHHNGIKYNDKTGIYSVKADCDLDGFVKEAVKRGSDFTNFYAIPGLVGSAVCGNSGSEGIDICNHVKSITVYDFEAREYKTIDISGDGFFSKRNSFISNHNKEKTYYIITECELYAENIGKSECESKIRKKKEYRKSSDENAVGTAGSFWRGAALPETESTKGKKIRDLLKELSLNTYDINGARYVTDKCFLKTENCTTDKDVARLLKYSMDEINRKFGFFPENEVVILDHDGRIDVKEFINRYY